MSNSVFVFLVFVLLMHRNKRQAWIVLNRDLTMTNCSRVFLKKFCHVVLTLCLFKVQKASFSSSAERFDAMLVI